MEIKQKGNKEVRIRDHPLGRSSSVSGIIHGDSLGRSNHYVDALERFKRDFATIDFEERKKKREARLQDEKKKRNIAIMRQMQTKKHEQQTLHKLLTRQSESQALHGLGTKKTAHTHSIPVNPINQQYENNERGKMQANQDQSQKINRLVRAHHLQTCGNSGYNIINGRSSTTLDSLVPERSQEVFETKLNQYYQKFRIQPQ